MRALVYDGPNRLAVREAPDPLPGPGEVLVRPRYVGICGSDLHVRLGELPVTPPTIIGHEVVGEVVRSADGGPPPGTRVAIEPLLSCGECRACREGNRHVCRSLKVMGVHADGGAAELFRVPARLLHPLPDGLDWETAACTEPASVAVHMTRRAEIGLGDLVLVLGGGPIGFLVASVARAAGARPIVSEVSAARLEICRRAGLEVVDARTADPLEVVRGLSDGEGADVVVDAVGHPSVTPLITTATRVRGTVLAAGIYSDVPPVDLRTVIFKELRIIGSRVYTGRDMDTAIDLLATGQLDVSGLVTRIVPLEQAVTGGFDALAASRDEMKILIGIPGA